MSDISAGWYKDPADPATQRYWDGEGWLGKALPADATPPDGPPPAEEPAGPPTAPTPTSAPAPTVAPGGPAAPVSQSPPGPGTLPPGWTPPQSWTPPPGWVPPPGWKPPPGWSAPPGTPGLPGMQMAYTYRPQVRPHGFALAGPAQRLMARLLDILAVLLLNIVVNGWFAYQWALEVAPMLREAMKDPLSAQPEPSQRSQSLILAMLVIATALWLAYEVPAIGSTGQTLGKRLMHIRVVAVENTEPLGFGRAFRRWGRLGLWTPLWACWGIGLLFQLIDSASLLFDRTARQSLHDKTARTVVIEAPPRVPQQPDAGARGGSTAGTGVPDDDPDPTGGVR